MARQARAGLVQRQVGQAVQFERLAADHVEQARAIAFRLHALLDAPAAQPRGVGHQPGAQALGQRAQEVALHVVHQQHRAPRLQAPARQVGRQLLGSRQGIGGDFGNAAHATVSRGKVALGIASAPDQAITALSACQGFSRGSQRLV